MSPERMRGGGRERAARHEPAAPFRIIERVRWSDIDAAGIVCYGAYLRFFEAAETELLRASGLTTSGVRERHGIWLVRRRIECDFHQPIRLDEELEIFASISGIGRTSLELRFLGRRVGERPPAVEGRYVLVAVDRDTLRPMPLPDAMRRVLARAEVGAGTTGGTACSGPAAAAEGLRDRGRREDRMHAAASDEMACRVEPSADGPRTGRANAESHRPEHEHGRGRGRSYSSG